MSEKQTASDQRNHESESRKDGLFSIVLGGVFFSAGLYGLMFGYQVLGLGFLIANIACGLLAGLEISRGLLSKAILSLPFSSLLYDLSGPFIFLFVCLSASLGAICIGFPILILGILTVISPPLSVKVNLWVTDYLNQSNFRF